jgi:hypothetical protein
MLYKVASSDGQVRWQPNIPYILIYASTSLYYFKKHIYSVDLLQPVVAAYLAAVATHYSHMLPHVQQGCTCFSLQLTDVTSILKLRCWTTRWKDHSLSLVCSSTLLQSYTVFGSCECPCCNACACKNALEF